MALADLDSGGTIDPEEMLTILRDVYGKKNALPPLAVRIAQKIKNYNGKMARPFLCIAPRFALPLRRVLGDDATMAVVSAVVVAVASGRSHSAHS